MKYQIFYSETAKNDLKNIYRYIYNELCEPQIAAKQVQRIINEIRSLDEIPSRHKIYDAEPWHSQGLRTFSVNNYLVFYFVDEINGTVKIVRIMYGGRDIKTLLSETHL